MLLLNFKGCGKEKCEAIVTSEIVEFHLDITITSFWATTSLGFLAGKAEKHVIWKGILRREIVGQYSYWIDILDRNYHVVSSIRLGDVTSFIFESFVIVSSITRLVLPLS